MRKKTNKQYRKFCESSRRHWTFMSYKVSHHSKAISEIKIPNCHWDYWAGERCKVLNSIPKSVPDWLLEQNIPVLIYTSATFRDYKPCVCIYIYILNPFSFSLFFLLPTIISKSDQFFYFPNVLSTPCSHISTLAHLSFKPFLPHPFLFFLSLSLTFYFLTITPQTFQRFCLHISSKFQFTSFSFSYLWPTSTT